MENASAEEDRIELGEQIHSYDPYSPRRRSAERTREQSGSLLDSAKTEEDSGHVLEMEKTEEEDSAFSSPHMSRARAQVVDEYRSPYDPITTNSGLLLTHRRNTPTPKKSMLDESPSLQQHQQQSQRTRNSSPYFDKSHPSQRRMRERFEVENPWSSNTSDTFLSQVKKLFTYARVWVFLSALVLVLGTVILLHHVREPAESTNTVGKESSISDNSEMKNQGSQQQSLQRVQFAQNGNASPLVSNAEGEQAPNQIVLIPLGTSRLDHRGNPLHRKLYQGWNEHLKHFRGDFANWIEHHGKSYQTDEEREFRFRIWTENHHRILEKNERIGPCRLTKQPIFGSNHFQDLTHEEFTGGFLNARNVPLETKVRKRPLSSGTLGAHIPAIRHPDVHQRYLQLTQERDEQQSQRRMSRRAYLCKWWDISCTLKWITETYFYGFYGIGGTMEPKYDAGQYPSRVDWREMGAITDVRAQDDCGACWAITAVECVESATFLSYGTLYDLSESEVIMCVDECEMCYGGWPEDAFDYIIEQNGIPLEQDIPYDGDNLLALTQAKAGESANLSEEDVDNYAAQICPAGSHDSNNNGYSGSNFARYGKIAGYGYATDKCVCYTDGSGCDCENQNEGLAVANLATYGPAVVCVDASEWKDYSGGIITSDITGCSAKFLDVNHCVQVVGYAFGTDDENNNEAQNQGSGSGDRKSGSADDDTNRQGYWIVRNQWSTYWGMNGYGYVAMGDNTCGILNDMIQVYTKK